MDLEQTRQALEQKLSVLTARLSRIEGHLRDPGSKDSQERAIEVENEEVLERLDESERAEVEHIRSALRRIEAGIYDTCARCQGEIAPRRLEALPYTSVCVSCAD